MGSMQLQQSYAIQIDRLTEMAISGPIYCHSITLKAFILCHYRA